MRTFKFSDDKSYKFWNIELAGKTFTVRFGRTGTKGQTQTKEFDTDEAARAAYDKLIKEKLGKGYVESTIPEPAVSTENVLEKALRDDPDDLANHSAYADWLTQQGDPRGEFIQVQLLLEDPSRPAKERKELQKQEAALLKEHGRQWLGDLADFLLEQRGVDDYLRQRGAGYKFQFARGWLDSVHVPRLSVAFARALAKSPQVRLLRRLQIEGQTYEDEEYEPGPDIPGGSHHPSMHALENCEHLRNLRVLHLGEPMEGEYSNCHTSGETAANLIANMPRIEEIYLLAHRVNMKKLFALPNLDNLRVLQIYHCTHYPLDVLARNAPMSNLSHILYYPHALEPDDDTAYITRAGVRALVRSKNLPKLTHVQLRLSDLSDAGCEDIVKSGILQRLKMLDLMHGCITDEGARTLAESPDLRNLDLLEISHNSLTSAGIQALEAAGIKVQAANQYSPGGEETEYLWMGDME